ncbi:MAG: hypothetical protein WDZ59_10760 [Pirellulales bacterium]
MSMKQPGKTPAQIRRENEKHLELVRQSHQQTEKPEADRRSDPPKK